MGNNIIAHLVFFSTYPTLTRLYHTHHTFEKHHTHMFIQTFKQLLWTYFPVPRFSKFSFPPLIFSPSIRLSHQYGYVQVQLCKSNKQRLKQIDQIIVNLLHFWAPSSIQRYEIWRFWGHYWCLRLHHFKLESIFKIKISHLKFETKSLSFSLSLSLSLFFFFFFFKF